MVRVAVELGLHHNPFKQKIFSDSECQLRVRDALDTLHDERTPTGDALPLAREPADLVPGVRLAVPDAVVDPLPLVLGKVRSILRSEDGVGFAQFVSRGSGVVEAIWGLARSLL